MPNIGPMEIAIVLIVALIVFGPKRLPELGKSLGKGIREFKGTIGGDKHEEAAEARTVESPPVAVAPGHATESAPAPKAGA
jgi:sec-independent protein translocase protein TatA